METKTRLRGSITEKRVSDLILGHLSILKFIKKNDIHVDSDKIEFRLT